MRKLRKASSLAGRALSFGKESPEIAVQSDHNPGARVTRVCLLLPHAALANRDDLSSIGPGLHKLAEAIKTVPGEVRAELHGQKLAYQRGFLDGALSAGVVVGMILAAAFLFRGKPSAFWERKI
jgi:hypothetical protein